MLRDIVNGRNVCPFRALWREIAEELMTKCRIFNQSPHKIHFGLLLSLLPNDLISYLRSSVNITHHNNISCSSFIIMAAEGDNVRLFNYWCRDEVPYDVTHVTIAAWVTIIPENAFRWHRNIVEVICHDKVEKVGGGAFDSCPSLRRVIMPGVEIVETDAFIDCKALTDVECGKLKIIREDAFRYCPSLGSIDLPSARIVERNAFANCPALTDVKFGSKLERIEEMAVCYCTSLARITIPLKDGIITHDGIFQGCENLKQVDLVEGVVHETVAALQLEEWRNDMNEEIDSINQILPTTPAGG